jgi:hypothetical protein
MGKVVIVSSTRASTRSDGGRQKEGWVRRRNPLKSPGDRQVPPCRARAVDKMMFNTASCGAWMWNYVRIAAIPQTPVILPYCFVNAARWHDDQPVVASEHYSWSSSHRMGSNSCFWTEALEPILWEVIPAFGQRPEGTSLHGPASESYQETGRAEQQQG